MLRQLQVMSGTFVCKELTVTAGQRYFLLKSSPGRFTWEDDTGNFFLIIVVRNDTSRTKNSWTSSKKFYWKSWWEDFSAAANLWIFVDLPSAQWSLKAPKTFWIISAGAQWSQMVSYCSWLLNQFCGGKQMQQKTYAVAFAVKPFHTFAIRACWKNVKWSGRLAKFWKVDLQSMHCHAWEKEKCCKA